MDYYLAKRHRDVGALAGCLITGTALNTVVLTESFQLASGIATLAWVDGRRIRGN